MLSISANMKKTYFFKENKVEKDAYGEFHIDGYRFSALVSFKAIKSHSYSVTGFAFIAN